MTELPPWPPTAATFQPSMAKEQAIKIQPNMVRKNPQICITRSSMFNTLLCCQILISELSSFLFACTSLAVFSPSSLFCLHLLHTSLSSFYTYCFSKVLISLLFTRSQLIRIFYFFWLFYKSVVENWLRRHCALLSM